MNSSKNCVVLALDLATAAGFALLRADGRIESGEERFDVRKNEGEGARYLKFRRWLVEIKAAHPELARLVFEKTQGPTRQSPQIYCGLLATLQMFGEHHQIAYDGIPVSTVKKQFAGSGRAQKCDVIAQCKAMGFNPGGHNEADAIALLHVATGRAPLLTMSGATPKKRAPKPQPELAPGANPF